MVQAAIAQQCRPAHPCQPAAAAVLGPLLAPSVAACRSSCCCGSLWQVRDNGRRCNWHDAIACSSAQLLSLQLPSCLAGPWHASRRLPRWGCKPKFPHHDHHRASSFCRRASPAHRCRPAWQCHTHTWPAPGAGTSNTDSLQDTARHLPEAAGHLPEAAQHHHGRQEDVHHEADLLHTVGHSQRAVWMPAPGRCLQRQGCISGHQAAALHRNQGRPCQGEQVGVPLQPHLLAAATR